MHQALVTPTKEDSKVMIRMNLIKANEASAKDANLAEKLLERMQASLKAKPQEQSLHQ